MIILWLLNVFLKKIAEMELKFNNVNGNDDMYVIHFHHPGQFLYPTDKRDKIIYRANEKLFIQVAHDVSTI